MDSSINQHQQNLAAIIHLSTFSKYVFPFGNFILPIVLWMSNKKDSTFIDENGKQAINFQISILLYSIILGLISIPVFFNFAFNFTNIFDILAHNTHEFKLENLSDFSGNLILLFVVAVISLVLFVLDIFAVISATIKANKGETYSYPLSIQFIK
jgi:hypothetical protein